MFTRSLVFAVVASWLVPSSQAQDFVVPDLNDVARAIVDGTNQLRRQQQRRELVPHDKLTAATRYFAAFLSEGREYGHTADGHRPEERAAQYGYEYCIVTENIAYQFRSSGFSAEELVQGFLQGWERSPGHRRNMLDPDVTDIGVAVAYNADNRHYYAVQMFGLPRAAMIEFSVTNRARAAVSYRLDERNVPLEPGVTRTHRRCGSVRVEILWPGGGTPTTVTPRHGDRYSIARDAAGQWRLRKD